MLYYVLCSLFLGPSIHIITYLATLIFFRCINFSIHFNRAGVRLLSWCLFDIFWSSTALGHCLLLYGKKTKQKKALFLFILGDLYLRNDTSNLVSTVYAVRRSGRWQVSKLTGAH